MPPPFQWWRQSGLRSLMGPCLHPPGTCAQVHQLLFRSVGLWPRATVLPGEGPQLCLLLWAYPAVKPACSCALLAQPHSRPPLTHMHAGLLPLSCRPCHCTGLPGLPGCCHFHRSGQERTHCTGKGRRKAPREGRVHRRCPRHSSSAFAHGSAKLIPPSCTFVMAADGLRDKPGMGVCTRA